MLLQLPSRVQLIRVAADLTRAAYTRSSKKTCVVSSCLEAKIFPDTVREGLSFE